MTLQLNNIIIKLMSEKDALYETLKEKIDVIEFKSKEINDLKTRLLSEIEIFKHNEINLIAKNRELNDELKKATEIIQFKSKEIYDLKTFQNNLNLNTNNGTIYGLDDTKSNKITFKSNPELGGK